MKLTVLRFYQRRSSALGNAMDMNSKTVSLEAYHGIPDGWSKREILKLHEVLGGRHVISVPEAREPGAPNWLPDRYNWLQYRATLYAVGAGARAGDTACVEIAIRFIELDYFGSYSGFIKERLARALKPEYLADHQKRRLAQHFSELAEKRQFLKEYREYAKLQKRIRQHEQ